ncbi:MAG: putative sugar O-methyltransferase [Candidatus Zapsychrus exili]|nr:putative sugar O-methyltransferase [Candidatus Zapsychrus exili]
MNSTRNILDKLYQDYYCEDNTEEISRSSHWREFHNKANVKMTDGKFDSLCGYGFGDLEQQGIASKFFHWLTNETYLIWIDNRKEILKTIKIAKKITKKMGFHFSYECFRQVCSFIVFSKDIPKDKEIRVINIGDGYGFMSNLIKEVFPNAKICLVDLGKTLLFQANFCNKVHKNARHYLVSKDSFAQKLALDSDFLYCPAENLDLLDSFSFDLAITIVSMQEMNEETVLRYFKFLRKYLKEDNLFYCCNREKNSFLMEKYLAL